jgi:hypothetical protein
MADPASDGADPRPLRRADADLRWPITVMDAGIGGTKFAERGVMELRANVWKPRLHPVAREGEREGAT